MKKHIFRAILFCLLSLLGFTRFASAQSISGPTAVLANTETYYYLDGWNLQNIDWSVSYPNEIVEYAPDNSYVVVRWVASGEQSISAVFTIDGNFSFAWLNVTIVPPLNGGTISLQRTSVVYDVESPVLLNQSSGSGGICSAPSQYEQYTYSWEYSYDNATWFTVTIPGSSNTSFLNALDPITRTTYYRRKISCLGAGVFAYSNTVIANVAPTLTGGSIGSSQAIASSAVPAGLTNIGLPQGGDGTYTYQWESSADNIIWNTVSGATSNFYQPPAISQSTFYRRKVISGTQWRYSNTVRVLIANSASQNKPSGTIVNGTATAETMPSYVGITSDDLNSITRVDIYKPGVTDVSQITSLTEKSDVRRATAYVDGIGRILQNVLHTESTSGKDYTDIVAYDQYGNQRVQFLPYPASTDQNNMGSFRADGVAEQKAFYDGLTQQTENYYYTQYTSEASEFSRVNKSMMPGKSFVGQQIGFSDERRYNTALDKVRIWSIEDSENAIPQSTDTYAAGTLSVNVSTSAQNDIITSYVDPSGKVVCESVKSGTMDDEENTIRTYYVYNDLGLLRYVISPQAVKYCRVNNNWNLDANTASRNVLKALCYKYCYDAEGRIVLKQPAGTEGPEYYIYDPKGRLVFAQNHLMRTTVPGQWTVYFYDGLDRMLISGLYTNTSATRESLQALANTASGSGTVTNTIPPSTDMYLDSREPGIPRYEASNSITLLPGFETEANAEVTIEINAQPTPQTETFIADNPVPNVSGYEVLTAYYYDNYNWPGAKPFRTDFQNNAGSNPYPDLIVPRRVTEGLHTGMRRAVRGKTQMLTTTFYYDQKGRTIQKQQENIAGGVDVSTTQYDFSGKILSIYSQHKNPQSVKTAEIKELVKYAYENRNKLKEIRHTLIDQPGMSEKVLSTFTYDDRGAVTTQTLGNIETLEFEYNLLGNLTGINAAYARNKANQHYFGMELFYDKGFEVSRKDGMATGVTWRRRGNEDEEHAYGYNYDYAARLTKADYTQNTSGVWDNGTADFKVTIPEYDDNGNIKRMTHEGMLLGNVKSSLDNLVYSYEDNEYSNRIRTISDDKGNQQQGDFKDFADTGGGPDYEYDVDGNITKDRNRGISIVYDHLSNKPTKITFDDIPGRSIEYVYSMGNEKLQQIVKDNGNVTTYTYIDGIVYRNNELAILPHEQGRIRTNANGQFVYDYFIKDNLGNVRTVITEETNEIYYRASHEDNPQPTPVIAERDAFNFAVEPENIPSGHKFYDYAGTNRKFIKLNGNTPDKKIGTSKVLRVMAGDALEIGIMSYYVQNSPANNIPNQPVNQILSQLVNALLGPVTSIIPNGHGNLLQSSSNGNVLNTQDITSFISNNQTNNPPSLVPQAYLNYALFDDNFKFVSGGAIRVSQPDVITPLAAQVNVVKNGYVYIYPSNESPSDVYFDDLVVKHTTGHLLQEDSYYPFGLSIRALSSMALNRQKNDYLFNGIEKLSEFDLEIYDAFFRNLDPQTGRWWQRDPESEKYRSLSPYNLSGNNPSCFSDPLGNDWFENVARNAYIWLESSDQTAVIGNELYRNIGTVLRQEKNGLVYLYFGKELAAIIDGSLTVTPYYKGQQEFIQWAMSRTTPDMMKALLNDMLASKVRNEAQMGRGITGGPSPERVDVLRREVNREQIPTLKDLWAIEVTNTDPHDLLYGFNPFARANFRSVRGRAVFTREEAMDMWLQTGGELVTLWLGSAGFTKGAFEAVEFKTAIRASKTELKPLGLGSTGRTEAANLTEQLAIKEIMSDPTLGKIVMTGMKDSRWLGWNKMQYTHTALDGTKTTIHYVGKFENGVLKAVDDFKFK